MARKTLSVLRKELLQELRNRAALNIVMLFSIITLSLVSFTTGGNGLSPSVLSALLWLILFFSASAGLARTFMKEEESGTLLALRLRAQPWPVFLGKALCNLLLLLLTEAVTVPLFFLVNNTRPAAPCFFMFFVILVSVGMASLCTMVGMMIVGSSAKGPLYSVLAVPLLLPLLLIAVKGTQTALTDPVWSAGLPFATAALSFSGITLVACLLLFEFIWND